MSEVDPGVFVAHTSSHTLILAIHINDCALTGSSSKLINAYKQKLNERYVLSDLGPIHWLLGIEISHDHAACTGEREGGQGGRGIAGYLCVSHMLLVLL